jgi:hypothetical protein
MYLFKDSKPLKLGVMRTGRGEIAVFTLRPSVLPLTVHGKIPLLVAPLRSVNREG